MPVGHVLPVPHAIEQYASNVNVVLFWIGFVGVGMIPTGRSHFAVPGLPMKIAVHFAVSAGVVLNGPGFPCASVMNDAPM